MLISGSDAGNLASTESESDGVHQEQPELLREHGWGFLNSSPSSNSSLTNRVLSFGAQNRSELEQVLGKQQPERGGDGMMSRGEDFVDGQVILQTLGGQRWDPGLQGMESGLTRDFLGVGTGEGGGGGGDGPFLVALKMESAATLLVIEWIHGQFIEVKVNF